MPVANTTYTATAGGTTTLTVDSRANLIFTGTLTQTVVLPVVSTLAVGFSYRIVNESKEQILVQSSGANTVFVLSADQSAIFTCDAITGTGASSWGVDARPVSKPQYVQQLQSTSDDTVASASTLVLTGKGPQVDVSGVTTITAITLADGEERFLRFVSSLQIIYSSSLLTITRQDLTVSPGSWCHVKGGASSVVTMLSYQDSSGAPIIEALDILTGTLKPRNPSESLWMDLSAGLDKIAWITSFSTGEIVWDMGSISTLRVWGMPNVSGEIVLDSATQTLTNKSIDASQLAGTVVAARMPALTGDVTSSAGAVATTIAAGAVTFAKVASAAISDDTTLAGDSSSKLVTEHAAKTYSDNLKAAIKFKTDCRAASTGNVTVSNPGTSSFDGVTLSSGDRLLLRNQSSAAENGPYTFNGSSSALTRTTDGDSGTELVSATFPIREGTVYADTWQTITNDSITLGSTAIVFTQTAGTGTYVAGSGLALTGNSFAITAGGVTFAMLSTAAWDNDPDMTANSSTVLPTQSAVRGYAYSVATGQGYVSTSYFDAAPTASLAILRDSNANAFTNNFIYNYATTATAAGTTTLLVTSANTQFFTGSTTQICKLPVASTLTLNHQFFVVNNSTGAVTVNSSGSNAVKILAAGTKATFTCILTSGTTAASWDTDYEAVAVTSGKKLSATQSITITGTDATVMTFPTTTATIARTDAAQSFTGDQTFAAKIIGSAQIRLKGYTVAGLPAGTQGDTAFATDLLTPTFLVAAVGGGAVVGPVFYNGTTWVSF